jgi:hypothetical protein
MEPRDSEQRPLTKKKLRWMAEGLTERQAIFVDAVLRGESEQKARRLARFKEALHEVWTPVVRDAVIHGLKVQLSLQQAQLVTLAGIAGSKLRSVLLHEKQDPGVIVAAFRAIHDAINKSVQMPSMTQMQAGQTHAEITRVVTEVLKLPESVALEYAETGRLRPGAWLQTGAIQIPQREEQDGGEPGTEGGVGDGVPRLPAGGHHPAPADPSVGRGEDQDIPGDGEQVRKEAGG